MKFLWKKNSDKSTAEVEDNATLPITYGCKVYALSETGPTRNINEDSILYSYPDGHFKTFFGMVADGMGGHQAGEIASKIACDTANQYIANHAEQTNIPSMLEDCIQAAQKAILKAAEDNSSYNGMGTTATMIFIREGNLHFAHIGDSRLYQLKNNKLSQCTSDNTLVNEMVKDGKISEEEALTHDMKHVLTQALGSVKQIHPEVSANPVPIQPGDVFFLCSDGIYDVLQPQEIEKLLNMRSYELAMDCIKALCMQRKASDNFTAMLVEIISEERLQVPVTKELNVML
jgi:protein phosphatase